MNNNPTTVAEANELVQRPISATKSERGTMHYTTGRSAKKWNPLYYETISGHGFKRWKKNLTKDAPRTTTVRVRLYGEGVNDAAEKLQKAGVDGSCIEFPTCPECGGSVRLYHDYGRKDAPPKYLGSGVVDPEYRGWEWRTRQDYRDRLLNSAR